MGEWVATEKGARDEKHKKQYEWSWKKAAVIHQIDGNPRWDNGITFDIKIFVFALAASRGVCVCLSEIYFHAERIAITPVDGFRFVRTIFITENRNFD